MKKLILLFLSAFSSILLLSCSSSYFTDMDVLKTELNVKQFPEQINYPEADAVVLQELHDVTVKITENYDLETIEKVSKVIKLFKNVEDYASVEIPVSSGDKINDLNARTIKPDGTIILLKSDDFHTITGSDNGEVFYSDEKKIKFTFPAIEKNSIIEYNYTIEEEYPFVMDVWNVQGAIPKLENIYKLTVPTLLVTPKDKGGAGWNWRFKSYNFIVDNPDFAQNLNPSGGSLDASLSFTWVKKNVPAFDPDPMMPPYDEYLQYVKFAPSQWLGWNDISDWYYNKLYKPQMIITDKITSKAKELTKNCSDETEKIEKLFDYIQSVRYVAIELGKGGLTPTLPDKVLERNYGDCKDKSTLLVSLLNALNINVKPVLVLTSDDGRLDPAFPSWNFNHMIVKAVTKDGKTYWMDPTVDHCRLGELPYTCQNIGVLVLNDDGTSQVEVTPPTTSDDNVKVINIAASYADNNSADFDIAIKFKGEFNFSYRSFFNDKTKDDMLKYCKSLVADNYLDAKVTDYSLSNLDSLNSDLKLEFKLNVPNAVTTQGNFNFLNVDPFNFVSGFTWLGRDKRTYDMEFDFPYSIKEETTVKLPDKRYVIKELPSNYSRIEEGISFNKSYNTVSPDKFTSDVAFSISKKFIRANHFEDVKRFFNNVKNKMNEKIILTSN